MLLTDILVLFLLIIITAFFVASEFAIVRVRKTKLETMIQSGNKRAIAAKKIVTELDSYLSATQLGITMTSLGIGWIGDPSVGRLVDIVLGHFALSKSFSLTLSVILSFMIITFFNVVLGELAPKTVAIQKSEQWILFVARPLIIFNYVMFPFIWTLNQSANAVAKLFGAKSPRETDVAHTEEELRQILSESYQYGEINQAEYRYVNRIFDFDDRIAKEVMVPRTEVICLYKDLPLEENLKLMNGKYTRYPIGIGDKDHIVGLINIKEIFYATYVTRNLKDLDTYIHPIIQVIETIPIKQLLLRMQKEQQHMALLLDEYGGTSGIVTVEDILEEIVGDIRDEFDLDERPRIERLSDNHYLFEGKVLLDEVNHQLNLSVYHEEIDTIGGYLLSEIPDASLGSKISIGHYDFEIIDMDGHQIKQIRATPK